MNKLMLLCLILFSFQIMYVQSMDNTKDKMKKESNTESSSTGEGNAAGIAIGSIILGGIAGTVIGHAIFGGAVDAAGAVDASKSNIRHSSEANEFVAGAVDASKSNIRHSLEANEFVAGAVDASKIRPFNMIENLKQSRLASEVPKIFKDMHDHTHMSLFAILVIVCSVVTTLALCITAAYHITKKKQQSDIAYTTIGLI